MLFWLLWHFDIITTWFSIKIFPVPPVNWQTSDPGLNKLVISLRVRVILCEPIGPNSNLIKKKAYYVPIRQEINILAFISNLFYISVWYSIQMIAPFVWTQPFILWLMECVIIRCVLLYWLVSLPVLKFIVRVVINIKTRDSSGYDWKTTDKLWEDGKSIKAIPQILTLASTIVWNILKKDCYYLNSLSYSSLKVRLRKISTVDDRNVVCAVEDKP